MGPSHTPGRRNVDPRSTRVALALLGICLVGIGIRQRLFTVGWAAGSVPDQTTPTAHPPETRPPGATARPTATATPSPSATATPSPTSTSNRPPPTVTLLEPADGAVLPQPVGGKVWHFRWNVSPVPRCSSSVFLEGPGGRRIDGYGGENVVGMTFDYATSNELPDDALGPWRWHAEASCPQGGGRSGFRTFQVERAPNPIPPPTAFPGIVRLQDDAASDENDFGNAVAISEAFAVVGAERTSVEAPDAGAALVFAGTGGRWPLASRLTASPAYTDTRFGDSVALSGERILVGAWSKLGLRVFRHEASGWHPEGALASPDPLADDQFGMAVDLDGDTALVGAPWDAEKGFEAGAVYVFARRPDGWVRQAKLTADDASDMAWFGTGVAIDGDTAVVHASRADVGYVFVRQGTAWTQQARLTAPGGLHDDNYGDHVDVRGNVAVIGVPYQDVSGGSGASGAADVTRAGTAFVFERAGSAWHVADQLKANPLSANARFGMSVALGGPADHPLILVGAPGFDPGYGMADMGAAFVFGRAAGGWKQTGMLLSGAPARGESFGLAVGVSGSLAGDGHGMGEAGPLAIVGAPNSTAFPASIPGTAYIFTLGGQPAGTPTVRPGDGRRMIFLPATVSNGNLGELALGGRAQRENGRPAPPRAEPLGAARLSSPASGRGRSDRNRGPAVRGVD